MNTFFKIFIQILSQIQKERNYQMIKAEVNMKTASERIKNMTPEQFINQPMGFFERLYQEALEGIDLTIEDVRPKKRERG